jgi:succinoglycan biosynthesis transport protein ExoP
MDPQPFSNDVRRYLLLLWHWAWLIILVTAAAGGIAFVYNQRTTQPIYRVNTTVLIEAPPTISSEYAAIVTSERLASTYAKLMTTKPIRNTVAERLGLGGLSASISATPVEGTQFIEVRVEDTDPVRAAQVANTVVEVFSEQNQASQAARYSASKDSLAAQLAEMDQRIQDTSITLEQLGEAPEQQVKRSQLETTLTQYRQIYASLLQSYEEIRLAEAQSTFKVLLVEPATPPINPTRVPVLQNTILASIVGLMMAVGFVFLVEALDDTVKGPDDVIRHLGLPVLGLIARTDTTEVPVSALQPRSPVTEAFRSLRTNIQFASVDYPVRTVLVTSTSPSEGKTTIATNLGVVLAQGGLQVVLLDADLRRPRIHRVMSIPNRKGLTSLFVQEKVHLDGTLTQTKVPRLSVVTSGNLPPNPSELLGSDKMFEILTEVKKNADVVVVDTPPLMAVTDAAVLSRHVDGILLVIKPGVTKLGATKQTVDQLQRIGANILGVVFNDVELRRSRYSYYYYNNGYYYYYRDYYGSDVRRKRKVASRKKTTIKKSR